MMSCYLGEGGLDAGHVVGPGARGAVNQGVTILSSAHQTVSLPSGFVDALVTIPAMFLFHHQNIGPTHTLTSLPLGFL